jgi:hypothetical protein
LIEGTLGIMLAGKACTLASGDCLHFRLQGATAFSTDAGTPYVFLLA